MFRRIDRLQVLASLICACALQTAHAQTPAPTGSITGRIVDLQTGEPLAKATVALGGTAINATTDQDGHFTLNNVPAGSVELRISTVGYGLLKRRVEVTPQANLELDIHLGQDALRDTLQSKQQITVTAGPFDPAVPDAPSQYTLNSTERQDLSTILANDPFRAVDYLPSVTANQDFYADFAVRGAGPSHIGVYLDGALVDHPAYTLEDSAELGSLSVINGDTVGSLSLLSGAFPPQFGDRTGAILNVLTRDGDHDRVDTRFTADVLGAVLTSEGPLGKAKKASWLASGRQSYLAFLLSRLGVAGGLTLNYNDLFGKLVDAPNDQNKFSAESTFGSIHSLRSPDYTAGQEASFFTTGAAQHGLTSAHWDWLPSAKTLLQSQAFWTYDHEHDTNLNNAVNLDTTSNNYGLRTDLTHQLGSANNVQGGLELRFSNQQRDSTTQWNYAAKSLSPDLLPFDHYASSAELPGGYLQDTITLYNKRLTFDLGARWEYFTPSSQDVYLPHAGLTFKPFAKTNLSAAFGQYAQMPALQQLYGAFDTPTLRAERATHENVAIDQLLNEKTRLHVELYNRAEHGDIYSPQTEFRLLPNGQTGFPTLGPVLGNNLKAYARGFEMQLQRRSANRLSGWVSYARSASRYWQPQTDLSFAGDYDQRNTFSAYAAFRLTRTIDISANTRYGSGYPTPGFLQLSPYSPQGSDSNTTVTYGLSQFRNTLRPANYLRNDARVSKVFTRRHYNLTLHGEIENYTGHRNYSYYAFVANSNVARYPYVYADRQNTLPLLPAGGFTLEF